MQNRIAVIVKYAHKDIIHLQVILSRSTALELSALQLVILTETSLMSN